MALIMSKDWQGVERFLCQDGRPVHENEVLLDFRGDQHMITGGTAPHKESSQGFVYAGDQRFYASVVGCRWI